MSRRAQQNRGAGVRGTKHPRLFASEGALYPLLSHYLKRQQLLPVNQFHVRQGRIDLIGFEIDWEAVRKRYLAGPRQAILQPPLLRLFSLCALGRCYRLASLASILRISEVYLRRLLSGLPANTLVVKDKSFILRALPPPVVKRAVGVEAKLDDWRRCLTQAFSHRYYVDESYIALPCDRLGALDLALVKKRGVGVLSVSRAGVVPLLPANRNAANKEKRLWRLGLNERAWAFLSGGSILRHRLSEKGPPCCCRGLPPGDSNARIVAGGDKFLGFLEPLPKEVSSVLGSI